MIYYIENIAIYNHGSNHGMQGFFCGCSANNTNNSNSGNIVAGNNGNNSAITVNRNSTTTTQKYSYLTEPFDKLSFSQRIKVLQLIARLLKENENNNP